MSSNTLRGTDQSGGPKGSQSPEGQLGQQSQAGSDRDSQLDPSFTPASQPKSIQELTPEELKERIKEELRKIRALDCMVPEEDDRTARSNVPGRWSHGTEVPSPRAHGRDPRGEAPPNAPVDTRGGLDGDGGSITSPVAATGKSLSFSATLMGMPSPFAASSSPSTSTSTSTSRRSNIVEATAHVVAGGDRLRGTSLGRDIHLPSDLSLVAATTEVVLPEGSRALVVRGSPSPIPQSVSESEPTIVNPVGMAPGQSYRSSEDEHDLDHHMPWYDQSPPHEEVYEEPKGQLKYRKAFGIGLGVALAVGVFALVRSRAGDSSSSVSPSTSAAAPPEIGTRTPSATANSTPTAASGEIAQPDEVPPMVNPRARVSNPPIEYGPVMAAATTPTATPTRTAVPDSAGKGASANHPTPRSITTPEKSEADAPNEMKRRPNTSDDSPSRSEAAPPLKPSAATAQIAAPSSPPPSLTVKPTLAKPGSPKPSLGGASTSPAAASARSGASPPFIPAPTPTLAPPADPTPSRSATDRGRGKPAFDPDSTMPLNLD